MITAQQAMPEFLSAAELHGLTGYARPGQQAQWLKEQGIPHKVDGRRVIVSRVHSRQWLEGRAVVISEGIRCRIVGASSLPTNGLKARCAEGAV